MNCLVKLHFFADFFLWKVNFLHFLADFRAHCAVLVPFFQLIGFDPFLNACPQDLLDFRFQIFWTVGSYESSGFHSGFIFEIQIVFTFYDSQCGYNYFWIDPYLFRDGMWIMDSTAGQKILKSPGQKNSWNKFHKKIFLLENGKKIYIYL